MRTQPRRRAASRRPARALWVTAVLAVTLAACGGSGNDQIVNDLGGGNAESATPAAGDPGTFDPAEVQPPKPAAAPAEAPPQELVDAACEEGALVVYESTPGQPMKNVLAAFQEAYPCITEAEHVRLPAAEIPLRVSQESNARRPTADVGMTSADFPKQLHEQGMVEGVDWAEWGIPAELVTPYSVVTAASLYTIYYNTDMVAPDQAPKGWEDLIDPAWDGGVAVWSRPAPMALLVATWGPDRVQEFTQQLVDGGITVYEDNPTIPQAVGAGERAVGIVNYHAGVPVLESDAPVEAVIPDPLPATLIHAWVPTASAHPNAAKLFVNWLSTAEGSTKLEAETNRGNPLLPGTEFYELTQGVEISTFDAEHINVYSHWLEELSPSFR